MKRFLTAAAAVSLVAATVVTTPRPAASQPKTVIDDLLLESQTPWVSRGGAFTLRVSAPPADALPEGDLEYAVSVYPASTSRSAFAQTLIDRPRAAPLAVTTLGVQEASVDPSGAVTLEIGVQDPAQPRDRSRVALRGAGVYPVSVDLRTVGANVHARLLTHLVYVPDPTTGPKLAVGVAVPLRTPLALRADGTEVLRTSDVDALTSVASTLATLSGAGALLAPSPETLAALARSPRPNARAAVDALQEVARDHLVVAAPFVVTQSPPATSEERQAATERGHAVITEVMGKAPAAGVSIVTHPDDDRLQAELSGRLVLSDALLQSAADRVTPAEPVTIRRPGARSGGVIGLIADSGLAAHFDNKSSPVLTAHHVLADLSTIYFDNPGRFRSMIVNPQTTWNPNASVLAPLLAGLQSSPILETAAPDRLFALASARTTPRVRVLRPTPSPGVVPPGFASLRRDVASLRSVMGPGTEPAQSFADRLVIATGVALDADQRRRYTRNLALSVEAEGRKFRLPSGGSLTLTARRGGIPITVHSDAGYDARVILQLASDRLRFPGGATRDITLTRENTTQRFTVQSLGSGNIPLRVLLKSPDGELVLAEARLTIRSRNASGVGIALSVGALAFLLLWWYRHAAQRRRTSGP